VKPLRVTVSATSPVSPGKTMDMREFILSALTTFMAAPSVEFNTARQFRGPLTEGKWLSWFDWIGWLNDEYLSLPK
jgi:Mn2+/Fe2+ NRAMP family transporter